MLSYAKRNWAGPMFMEMFVTAAWSIWKERNGLIFQKIPPSHTSWMIRFKKDFGLLKHRTNAELGEVISSLIQNLH